jgi:hypothetical protein
MPRAAVVLALALAVLSAEASAAPSPWHAGGDLGLLFRDEAGGSRSVLPTLAPRVERLVREDTFLVASYGFAYSPAGNAIATASTQHHRLLLGVRRALPVRAASFSLACGPAATLMHTTLYDADVARASTTIVRAGAFAGLALDVPLDALTLRSGVQVLWTAGRVDVVVSLGGTWALGGAP